MVMLQMGVVPEQLLFAVHCTHAPELVLHTGVLPPHWLFIVHGPQV